MSGTAWEMEHSVETTASIAFAWKYMTDVTNWDDPPAQFSLEGKFAAGARGTTRMPGQPAQGWRLREVTTEKSYTIEFVLDRAILSFKWRFDPLPSGHTRLTQHLELVGENASAYLEDIQRAFAANLGPGMTRIAKAMDRAHAAG